jgi:hypothetical protein
VSKRLQAVYLLATCFFLFAGAAAFVLRCRDTIRAPYELDYGEGIVIWQAQHVANLPTAYRPLREAPYIVFHYTPLYQVVARVMDALVTHNILSAGRLVSFLAALLTCVLLGLLAWNALPPRFPLFLRAASATVAALLPLNLQTLSWAQLMRVDMLALAFTFAGLLLFALARSVPSLDYLAFLFFALAFFTKQTQLAAPAVCLLVAAAIDWGRAIRLAVSFGLWIAGGLIALSLPTHGAALLNLFAYNKNPFSFLSMFGIIEINVFTMAPIAAIAVALPIAGALRMASVPRARLLTVLRNWLKQSMTRRCAAICSLHLVAAFLLSFLCGKRGSNYNYFLEWNIACCVPVAMVVAFLLAQRGRRARASQIAALAVVLLFSNGGGVALGERLRRPVPWSYPRETALVIDYLQALPGPVYSENMTILAQSRKEVWAEPAIITVLAQSGSWNQADFLNRIRAGFFSAVIVTTSLDNTNRFTPEVREEVEHAYHFDRRFGAYQIYVPNSSQPPHPSIP